MTWTGHVRLDRSILDWEWYGDINTCRLFVHMILRANWKDGRFQGVEVPRGSFVSSYQNLASETGLSIKNVRTALKHLETTGEVAVNRHSKFSVFIVKNYCKYHSDGTVTGSQVAVKWQSSGSQVATIEESKKVRKKEIDIGVRFTPPTLENVIGYCREKGYSVDAERFIDFYSSKGWMIGKNRMKDWKAAVRNWARQEKQLGQPVKEVGTKFSNFEQRDYDFDELERQLLESQEGKK